MSKPTATLLADGRRLHLQHGPIDLIIGADGAGRDVAFRAAYSRFAPMLDELVAELPDLRKRNGGPVTGAVARSMVDAIAPHKSKGFVTPMIAVAGAVADAVLKAMTTATPLRRAYVNNGGDIALHLSGSTTFTTAIASLENADLGRLTLHGHDHVGGLATSGQGGRSLSMGIADAVTVLARTATQADAAATLIANAVDVVDLTDLAGRGTIQRRPACELDPDSDLQHRLVVTHVGALSKTTCDGALDRGAKVATNMLNDGLIVGAALFLRSQTRLVNLPSDLTLTQQRTAQYA